MRFMHANNGWSRIAPFPAADRLRRPYGYVFQKKKSPVKNRLIVSYWVHPLRRIYNYGSRALAFVLKHACMPSFTLWKTSDITPSLRRWIDD